MDSNDKNEDQDAFLDALRKKVRDKTRMREAVKEFLDSSEFTAAREVMQELFGFLENPDDKMETLLQIARCDVMVNGKIGAWTDNSIMSLIKSLENSSHDLRDMAEQKSGTEAAILFLYACKVLATEEKPNKPFEVAHRCIYLASHEIHQLASKEKGESHKASRLMVQMLDEMKKIEGLDHKLKISSVADCIARVGYILDKIGKEHEAFQLNCEGRDLMKHELGDEAPQYHVYAALSHNIGSRYGEQGMFEKAASYHKLSISEMEMAVDMAEDDRQQQLKKFHGDLELDLSMIEWSKSTGISPQQFATASAASRMAKNQSKDQEGGKSVTSQIAEQLESIKSQEFGRRQEKPESEKPTYDMIEEKAIREVLCEGEIKQNTNLQIMAYFERTGSTWENVRQMAKNRTGAGAVVLHLYTCKLLPFKETPDKVTREIGESFKRSRVTIEEMIQGSSAAVIKNVISLLHEMLKELKSVSQDNKNLRVQVICQCLNKLGSLYIQLNEYKLAVKHLAEGLLMFHGHYSDNASNHTVYASLSKNTAHAYSKMGDHAKSAEYYIKALSDIQKADAITSTTKKEKLAAFKKGFENALSFLERSDPETAEQMRRRLLSPDIVPGSTEGRLGNKRGSQRREMSSHHYSQGHATERQEQRNAKSPASHENARQVTSKTDKGATLVSVGQGIYVNHKRVLREGYQIFQGKLGGEDVAVKRIDFSEDHKREIEIMKNLPKHPHIVEFKAWSEWASKEMPGVKALYLAMELCRDKTLDELATESTFTHKERLSFLLQFTHGLRHIHANDVIHGDLKPHNLLQAVDKKAIKIGDFGISKRLEFGATHITAKATQMGTFGWMAPDTKVTKKYDIFSAGLIYYYVLSGGNQLKEVSDIPKLTCPDAAVARDLIASMIEEDPKKRPTAEAVIENPLFWDDAKKLTLVCDLAVDVLDAPSDAEIMRLLNNECRTTVLGGGWERLGSAQTATTSEAVRNVFLEVMAVSAVYLRHGSTTSLMRFLADCSHAYDRNDGGIRSALGTKSNLWMFFESRFPALFSRVFELASKCGYLWPTEQKFQFINKVSTLQGEDLGTRVAHFFNPSWFQRLLLNKADVKLLQNNVIKAGGKYKISKYSIYNMAVSNDRLEEGEYDGGSVYSLLHFIANRKRFFKVDGKIAAWIFCDDTTGLWTFISRKYSGILYEIILLSRDAPASVAANSS